MPPESTSELAASAPAGLARFAADALDFAAVRELLEQRAATSLGVRMLRQLEPLADVRAREALARAAEMIALAARGKDLVGLAGVTDPIQPLEAARRAGRALEEDQIVALREFVAAAVRIASWLAEREAELPATAALASKMPDLEPLALEIDAVVDERGKVKDEASDLLRRLRREIEAHERRIDRALRDLVRRAEVRAVLADLNLHRRGGRAVLAVRAKSRGRIPGIVHDHSQSGETVFVEPREVVELGNRLFECAADERREVGRLLIELQRAILARGDALARAADVVGRLELAVIAARFATDFEARVPAIASACRGPEASAGLVLRAARHPLLVQGQREGRIDAAVPIDLRLGAEFDLLILTGPNTGGKTLALKTAGLFALLVRCGFPVPCAEGTRVPLYDGVVADIGDEQEIRQSLSTFSSHVARIRAGLARASERTLFLLDELGGGTDPDQGAALSEALLEHLLARGVPTLASTHISRLKELAFRQPRAENASVEFDPETLAPRYRIQIGQAGESAALVIARRLGLPSGLVDRAEERLERTDDEVLRLMDAVGDARVQAERARSQAESQLVHAERASQEIEARRVELERHGELIEAEAQRDIEARVANARRRLERVRAVVDQLPASQKDAVLRDLELLDGELSGAALSERRQRFLDGLSKGAFVYLPRYQKRGLVQRVDRAKREVGVVVGSMRMRVSFDEISSYEGL